MPHGWHGLRGDGAPLANRRPRLITAAGGLFTGAAGTPEFHLQRSDATNSRAMGPSDDRTPA